MKNTKMEQLLQIDMQRAKYPVMNSKMLPLCARRLMQYYATQPNVNIVMTIGSLSTENTDEHSDIDLVIVYDDEGIPSKEDRVATIKRVSKDEVIFNSVDVHMWIFGTSDDIVINGQEICMQFFTKSYMQQKIDLIVSGLYEQIGMQYPLASLSSILNATVHMDKNGLYDELCARIDPYPKELKKLILDQELGMRLPYYLDRLQSAAARSDMPFANKMIGQAVDSIVYIMFALHEQFPNGPKRLFRQIDETVDANIATQLKDNLSDLYTTALNPTSIKNKQMILNTTLLLLQKEQLRIAA